MPSRKIKEYLDRNNVPYLTINHSLAFTAQKVAAASHISGWELAKTVIVKIDGKFAMAVLPASTRINMEILKSVVGSMNVELATERNLPIFSPNVK